MWGRLAQWLASQTTDQGVPGSSTGRCAVRCGLEKVTYTHCLVLVEPRKPWTYDRRGKTVTRLASTLCLVSRPDSIDETVLSLSSYDSYMNLKSLNLKHPCA